MARSAATRTTVALPEWIRPQLTQLVKEAPEGPEWLHEIKFDGYRMHARLDRSTVRLLTPTGLDWTNSRRSPRRCRQSARAAKPRVVRFWSGGVTPSQIWAATPKFQPFLEKVVAGIDEFEPICCLDCHPTHPRRMVIS